MPSIKAGNINLNYDTYGEGEPLLLIMGFGMSGAGWIPSLPFFNGFKCIYFDNRGTGLSDKPEGIYTVEGMADDASNLLRALGIAKAKVFGVSMGGMIAQELTLRHPEQVTKVVLGCTMAGGPTAKMASPEILDRLMTANKIMATDPEKGFDILLPAIMPPEFVAEHPEIKADDGRGSEDDAADTGGNLRSPIMLGASPRAEGEEWPKAMKAAPTEETASAIHPTRSIRSCAKMLAPTANTTGSVPTISAAWETVVRASPANCSRNCTGTPRKAATSRMRHPRAPIPDVLAEELG